jgi:LPXTG-motif cell wall-anchored protein
MDNVSLIRVIAGIGAFIVLGIIIWRRKRQTTD